MANTNGMRHPMTAKKNFTHEGTRFSEGNVFDALTPANAAALAAAGNAVYGDPANPANQQGKTAGGAGGIPLDNANLPTTEEIAAKLAVAEGNDKHPGARFGAVTPEVPVLETAGAKAVATPAKQEDTAQVNQDKLEGNSKDSAEGGTSESVVKANDAAGDTAPDAAKTKADSEAAANAPAADTKESKDAAKASIGTGGSTVKTTTTPGDAPVVRRTR